MEQQYKIYKCLVCGKIIKVLHEGTGILVCDNQPMELQEEKTEDIGNEKHVPVVEETETGILVKVGSIPHPMEKKHYIEWIEVQSNGKLYSKFLTPEDEPQAEFPLKKEDITQVREYCNIHRLWKTE